MDNNAQQQQSTQPPSAVGASSRNNKNLSIKEFFATRLMRARSFETGPTGGQHSPKEEPSNWFEEFKARMTKKSPNTQASKNLNSVQTVKETCDTNFLADLTEDCEDDVTSTTKTNLQTRLKETSMTFKPKETGLKKRNIQVISCESPDFDAASINTIFNRRDSRIYDRKSLLGEAIRKKLMKLITLLGWIISYLIPFNYNLPWKLLSLINFSFVVLVIGLTKQNKPDLKAFSFFNGFLCGLIIATLAFTIFAISFIVKLLPKSLDKTKKKDLQRKSISEELDANDTQNLLRESSNTTETFISTDRNDGQKSDEYSTFEVLESKPFGEVVDQPTAENLLVDNDYKGWMIEFVGDYELRTKSDFKLKLIYVKIENKVLYLCKPKNSHDAESTAFPVFVQQRIYNLGTANKYTASLLLPKNVRNIQKWIWSKKYPIKLEFQDETASVQPPPKSSETNSNSKNFQLTLFARCGREKEEWFRRFKTIFEENKLAQNQNHKKFSFQSDVSAAPSEEGIFGSMKSFRCNSPSLMSAGIQSSKSSHMLNESRKYNLDEKTSIKILDNNVGNLTRTKSCELLNDQSTTNQSDDGFSQRDVGNEIADDSTLTRETAEVFSQAIEYSNFLDNQPTLSYKDYMERVIESGEDATPTSDWFNALTGRIFFDVLSREYWSIWFKRKIQRKLYRIRLPYFMETLTLTNIDLGTNAPQFLNVVSHSFDSFGLSIDFDMTYSGGLSMTFETKLNLLKFKSDNANPSEAPSSTSNSTTQSASASNINNNPNSSSSTSTSGNNTGNRQHNQTSSQMMSESATKENSVSSSMNNSETNSTNEIGNKTQTSANQSSSGSARTSEESSDSCDSDSSSTSDSSSDEADVDEISDWEDYGAEKTRQNIVKFVDKIASSRYFQHATENRYIKKKLMDISNCPLVLIVQIQSLSGVLTVNVPPPQTDRIWYGFKPNPELTLKALPKMGDREVNLSHVTDWIEKKLGEEFRKILVIPNMEDIVLPVLKSDHLSYVTTTR